MCMKQLAAGQLPFLAQAQQIQQLLVDLGLSPWSESDRNVHLINIMEKHDQQEVLKGVHHQELLTQAIQHHSTEVS